MRAPGLTVEGLLEADELAGGDLGVRGQLLREARRGRKRAAELAGRLEAQRLHGVRTGVPERDGELHRLARHELRLVHEDVERHAARDEQRLLADRDLLGEELGDRTGRGMRALRARLARAVERGERPDEGRHRVGQPVGAQAAARRRDLGPGALELPPHLGGERPVAERRRDAGEGGVDPGEEVVAGRAARSLDEGVLAVARTELEEAPHVLRAVLAARLHGELHGRHAAPRVDGAERPRDRRALGREPGGAEECLGFPGSRSSRRSGRGRGSGSAERAKARKAVCPAA